MVPQVYLLAAATDFPFKLFILELKLARCLVLAATADRRHETTLICQ